MMALQHHTVHVNGIKQHYAEAGEGPPVILLHGFPEPETPGESRSRF